MQVPEILAETLDDLVEADLKKFKWYLTLQNVDGCKPISMCHLEKTSREETVSKLIESYGENQAVKATVTALRKMNNNNTADKLEKAYAAMGTATPAVAPPGAPGAPAATVMAKEGSVIFAPTISSGTSGAWNITINKS